MKDALLDDLAELVDGEAAARARHASALAEDGELRDLVHDAEELAERLRGAGADYRPPADLERRVYDALDAAQVGAAPGAGVARSRRDERAAPQAAGRPAETGAPAESSSSTQAQASGGTLRWAVAGFAFLTASAAAVGLGYYAFHRVAEAPKVVAPVTDHLWSGRVVWASPSADGVTIEPVRSVAAPGAPGAAVPVGARVRTDERTRVRIALADGTTWDLDRDTELELDTSRPRAARLLRGAALADVAHLQGGPDARIDLGHGTVEVLGTSLYLTNSAAQSSVEVLRGHVRVVGTRGTVDVEAGREAIVRADRAPRVTFATRSAKHARLAEAPTTEPALEGLGELRARRPGERTERERPLRIESTTISVDLVGSIARTTVEQSFRNEDSVTLEGVYRFPLPDGARIASLALEVEGRWEEGAFVDKERGEQIFRGVLRQATPQQQRQQQEEFIWVPGPWRDPALLEWQRGGRVELRIFPIPANGARRVRLTYEEAVPTDGETRTYVYPFPSVRRGEARVDRLAMQVTVHDRVQGLVEARGYAMRPSQDGDATKLSLEATGFAPAGSLVVDYAESEPGAELRYSAFEGSAVAAVSDISRERDAVRAAQTQLAADTRGFVALTMRPRLPGDLAFVPTDVAIVVDSSQSMVGERFARARTLAARVVAELDRRHRVAVFACDLGCRSMGELAQASASQAQLVDQFLAGIRPAGSTDVGRALATAGAGLGRAAGRARLLVYIGDGVGTVGATTPGTLEAAGRTLAAELDARISTVGLGDDADARALGALARAGAGVHVPFRAGRTTLDAAYEVVAATRGAMVDAVSVELPPGLEARAPAVLPTLAAGSELVVAARVTSDVRGDVVLRGKIGGEAFERRYPIEITREGSRKNAFVPRIWASLRIDDLDQRDDAAAEAESIALSRGFGVLSRRTALLVLESEAMFRAFGVDRPTSQLVFDPNDVEESTSDAAGGPELDALGDANAALDDIVDRATRGRTATDGPGFGGSGSVGQVASAAPSAPAPAPRRAETTSAPSAEAAPREDESARAPVTRAPPPPRPDGRWARRVRVREASITAASELPRSDPSAAEARYRENPDSRDRLRDLTQAYFRAGDDASATKHVDIWLARDPNDVDALSMAADLAARAGRRADALRTLSGIVEAQPNDRAAHERMIAAFDAIGDAGSSCAHKLALASLRGGDAGTVTDAVGCDARPRAFGAASGVPMLGTAPRSAVSIVGTFDADVDLALVSASGKRTSLLGGRRGVRVDAAASGTTESLSLRSLPVGTYYVEVVRTEASDESVSGSVAIRAHGSMRNVPFQLTRNRAVVARLVVTERIELVF